MTDKSPHDLLLDIKTKMSRNEITQQDGELEQIADQIFGDLDNAERVKLGLDRHNETISANRELHGPNKAMLEILAAMVAIGAFSWSASGGDVYTLILALTAAVIPAIVSWQFLKNN